MTQTFNPHGCWQIYIIGARGDWEAQATGRDLAAAMEHLLRWRREGQDVRLDWINDPVPVAAEWLGGEDDDS
jgi:hypothetical protein